MQSRNNLKLYYFEVKTCRLCKLAYGVDMLGEANKEVCPVCLSQRLKTHFLELSKMGYPDASKSEYGVLFHSVRNLCRTPGVVRVRCVS